jgi:hypothetical protein
MLGVTCTSLGLVVGGLVAHAATTSTPEVDRANATIKLAGTLKKATCLGEDNTNYLTYKGTWKGGESQIVPDPTDYSLNGALTVSGILWTINTQTGRGVLTANISLATSAATTAYAGKLTLVTQGEPAAGALVPARGWISASFGLPDEGVSPGDDSLIANVEFDLSPTGATGQFGDLAGSLNIPDFSAVTNVAPKALDGVC